MPISRFDISRSRFSPLWLIVGLVFGRAVGLIAGLNVAQWNFAEPAPLFFWQFFTAIASALFFSFLMTSKSPLNLKYGLLGLGGAFAFAVYSGEIWSMAQPGRDPAWLTTMTTSEGIFYEWYIIHMAWVGGIAGMITGLVILKKRAAAETPQTPNEPESGDMNGEREQG